MNYLIKIDYTGSEDKAGKISLKSSRGETLIDKEPIAVPAEAFSSRSGTFPIQGETYLKKEQLSKNFNYEKAVSALKETGVQQSISIGSALFISNPTGLNNTNNRLNSTSDTFVLSDSVFNKLNRISGAGEVKLEINKVSFLWMPEKVNKENNTTSIKTLINNFKDTQQAAQVLHDNTQIKIDAKSSSSIKPNLNKSSAPGKLRNQRAALDDDYSSTTLTSSRTVNSSNDLDALDILFMYNNPDLAPMYKPNSVLAWAMFFNHENDNVSSQAIQQNINQVKGFENVSETEVKYTPSGYSVDMYEDAQKTQKIGTMVYDGSSGSYTLQSPEGKQTNLTIDDNGSAKGMVSGGDKGDTSFEFVKDPNGTFKGNWESESNNGIKVSSGVSLDNDFSPTSSPFKSVDTESILKETRESTFNFTSPAPTFSPEPTVDVAPPPPPPPAPSTISWSSSADSYGNTSSFSP